MCLILHSRYQPREFATGLPRKTQTGLSIKSDTHRQPLKDVCEVFTSACLHSLEFFMACNLAESRLASVFTRTTLRQD